MSAAASPSTGRTYGVVRVCEAWGIPRSSFYAERSWQRASNDASHLTVTEPATVLLAAAPKPEPAVADVPAPSEAAIDESASSTPTWSASASSTSVRPARPRGPKPALSDARVLELVRADLHDSPFRGEGHRKVCARLRRAGHRVFARQVLRVMHQAQLLSPHRVVQGEVRAHEGTITTSRPDVMWGTDGMRVETVNDGWVWIFLTVEHWNAEVMGWHVTKRGDRFAALEPLKQGLLTLGRGIGKNAGAGLSVRLDHGTQYTSDHFRNEVKHLGMELSYGYVKEPQTNGVVERFNRTLKEQVIRGRVFHDVEELRAAVGTFVAAYNATWLVAKNGYRSPHDIRKMSTIQIAA